MTEHEKALSHYGVLGMKWGKRKKYQKSDTYEKRVVVEKGASAGHVTEGGNFRLKNGRMYIS